MKSITFTLIMILFATMLAGCAGTPCEGCNWKQQRNKQHQQSIVLQNIGFKNI